jgi:glycosyltransferase involved in cell wall biosynthesis
MQLALNGRFLTQGLTGVQRFASELTSAMDVLAADHRWPPTRVLRPHGGADAAFGHMETASVGRISGHGWEQFEHPWHARGQFLLSLGNTAPVLAGDRQAVVIHDAGVFDTPESYSRQFRTWYQMLHRTLAHTGATLITVSEFSRRRIAACLGIDPARLCVIPEGGEHILRQPADPDALTRHGLEAGRYALAVGTRAAHKNLDSLGDAAAMLAARGLTFAAVGAANPVVFRPAAGAQGPGAKVLGRVSDAELRTLYENALCLVFPSRYEGFGLPPLEAMTCGCPVVTSKVGAVPEVCGDAALYFDAAESGSLTNALQRLLDEAGLAAEMRQRGLVRAREFSWRRAAEVLLGTIEQAVGKAQS